MPGKWHFLGVFVIGYSCAKNRNMSEQKDLIALPPWMQEFQCTLQEAWELKDLEQTSSLQH